VKRSLVTLAVAVAMCVPTAGLSAPASAAPSTMAAHAQPVRSPDGKPAKAAYGKQASSRAQGSKEMPPSTALTNAAGAGCPLRTAGQYFCHAGAYQYATADGAYMSTTVESPQVESGDFHSLAEMAVQSSDQQQIIEIGWTVDPTQPTHDQLPRLFIYHWVNGVGTCYDTCDFVSNSSTVMPGMALTPSSTPVQFAIEYYQGNWWYSYNGTWFGYLPGSVWAGTYTQSGLIQEFGEVSAGSAQPCTDMGNGNFGSDPAAATISDVGYYNTTTTVNLSSNVDDSTLYDSQVTSPNSFGYGGPGAC
jgi:hypothetical protein